MDATPIDFGDVRPLAGGQSPMGIPSPRHDPPAALLLQWSAIHEAAATVGAIAGIEQAVVTAALEGGLGALRLASADPIAQDVQDLGDILQRGIAALLTAHTSGGRPQAAARALWQEFLDARDALLAPASTSGMAPAHA